MSNPDRTETTDLLDYPYRAEGYFVFDRSMNASKPIAKVSDSMLGFVQAKVIADALNRHRLSRPDLYERGAV